MNRSPEIGRVRQTAPMPWSWSEDPYAWQAAAGPLLEASPAGHTVPLTVLADALAGNDTGTLFGWWSGPGGEVTGVVSHTPPYALLLASVPDEAVGPLVDGLLAMPREVPGVLGSSAPAAQVASVWRSRTGGTAVLREALRLFLLERLTPPDPLPTGAARVATEADTDVLVPWVRAFDAETHAASDDAEAYVRNVLSYAGAVLWTAPDGPVALAASTRMAAGMVRVGPVFTPPEHRGRGYAAAATAALTRTLLERGARQVVLHTDLANPTSNAIYQRLGYVPLGDRLSLDFVPRETHLTLTRREAAP